MAIAATIALMVLSLFGVSQGVKKKQFSIPEALCALTVTFSLYYMAGLFNNFK